MSSEGGAVFTQISNDHKPSEEAEKIRIAKGGGEVYQNNNIMLGGPGGPVTQGPVRVLPGRLSVSRTFGDCQAKMEKYGGNPNVIVVDPEIHEVDISDDKHDFILLACDGIFDRLNSENTCQEVWSCVPNYMREYDMKQQTPNNRRNLKAGGIVRDNNDINQPMPDNLYHQICGNGVDQLLIKAMRYQSLDNLSIVMIGLKNFRQTLQEAWKMRRGDPNIQPQSVSNSMNKPPQSKVRISGQGSELRDSHQHLGKIRDRSSGAIIEAIFDQGKNHGQQPG